MATNPQSNEDQKNLNERLRSLKIDRAPTLSQGNKNRSPKLLLLGIAALVELAAITYLFLFSGTKTISAATVRVERAGATSGTSILSATGYVVAHHKIAVEIGRASCRERV